MPRVPCPHGDREEPEQRRGLGHHGELSGGSARVPAGGPDLSTVHQGHVSALCDPFMSRRGWASLLLPRMPTRPSFSALRLAFQTLLEALLLNLHLVLVLWGLGSHWGWSQPWSSQLRPFSPSGLCPHCCTWGRGTWAGG